jgi:hypothetical protein
MVACGPQERAAARCNPDFRHHHVILSAVIRRALASLTFGDAVPPGE